MAMTRNSGGLSLVWGVVLVLSGLWLGVMLSNRSVMLSLFFLGRQTIALPIGLWLFGAFLLGNGISLALLSFLQFAIDRLAQDQTRSRFAPQASPQNRPFPPAWDEEANPSDNPSLEREDLEQPPVPEEEEDAWDDPEWEADPAGQKSSPTPPPEKPNSPESPPPGTVYEASNPPRQGNQAGSSYSYRYRPSRRSQETVKPPVQPTQPHRKAQPGLPQKVVDVNYRVINPGSSSAPSPPVQSDRGWDDASDPADW